MNTFRISKVRYWPLWAFAALTLMLTGCNGGSGSAVSDSGVSFGRITSFGSIFVNGTRFNTDDAVIMVNGVTAVQDDLAEGMLVRVEGAWDDSGQGIARVVEYSDDIRGPMQEAQFDPLTGTGTLLIVGQTVEVNEQTLFSGTSRETLANDAYIGVSGWYQEQGGRYLASLVQMADAGRFPDGRQVEIKGFIADLNIDSRRFRIGSMEVDYGNARIEMENDRRVLDARDDGRFVEVKGRFEGGVLIASEVEREDGGNRLRAGSGSTGSTGFQVEFEGPISAVNDNRDMFVIHGVSVRVANDTRFDDGLRRSDLQPGLHIEVKGRWNGVGELVAWKIEPRSGSSRREGRQVEMKGRVESVGSNSFTIHGTIVNVDGRTEWDDGLRSIADLRPGRCVEVEYRLIDGSAFAKEVEGDDDCR